MKSSLLNLNLANGIPRQVDDNNRFYHLISLDAFNRQQLEIIFDTAEKFICDGEIPKVDYLHGVNVANLFFEPSTRTKVTFEIAQRNLSANVTSISMDFSSTRKGESLLDTVKNLEMMGIDLFVVRHQSNGAPLLIAKHLSEGKAVVNAGDGSHSHPTQALLDMATLRNHRRDFENLSVTIVGDFLHSRVARSQLIALRTLGVTDIRIVAPTTLLPSNIAELGVRYYEKLEDGIKDVDVILCLRLQQERMQKALIPSKKEFFQLFGINQKTLKHAKKDVLVLHPGPVNRGVEIDSEVMDGKHSLIFNQVKQGIAVRMAVMSLVMNKAPNLSP